MFVCLFVGFPFRIHDIFTLQMRITSSNNDQKLIEKVSILLIILTDLCAKVYGKSWVLEIQPQTINAPIYQVVQ